MDKRKLNPTFRACIKNMNQYYKPKNQKEDLSVYQLCSILLGYVHPPGKKKYTITRQDVDDFLYFIKVAEKECKKGDI